MATGIGPQTPISQFPLIQTDPWTNAINAYYKTQQAKGQTAQNEGQRTQNQLNQAKVPYAQQNEQEAAKRAVFMNQLTQSQIKQLEQVNSLYPELTEATIANMASENQKRTADIQIQQQMMAALGLRSGQGENMANGSGAPVNGGMDLFGQPMPKNQATQSNTQTQPNYSGLPSYAQQSAAKYFGLPEFSAQQQLQMDFLKNQQSQEFNKALEKSQGTTTTISDTQNRLKGIEGVMPILESILGQDIPSQLNVKVPLFGQLNSAEILSPGRQAAYQGKLSAAKEKALSAMGLEPTSEGLATVEKVFGRRGWESEGDYKLRLKDEMNSLVGDYERLGGEKGRFSQYNLGEGSKKTSSQQYSINDPKVIATAKKYGQTPEEVIRNLENARP